MLQNRSKIHIWASGTYWNRFLYIFWWRIYLESTKAVEYKNVSSGAHDDIEKVSLLVKQYTINWGMNKKMGPLNVEIMGQLGDKLSSDVLTECQHIIEKIETQVISVLNKYKKYIRSFCSNVR